jgi:DNA gyrase/topoisomerase IV subunit A
MNQVNNEIEKIEKIIEIQKGVLISCKSIDEVIKIIRKSKSEYQAITELIKHFSFSKLQAKAVANMKIQELSQEHVEGKIKFLELLKSFLEKLKE